MECPATASLPIPPSLRPSDPPLKWQQQWRPSRTTPTESEEPQCRRHRWTNAKTENRDNAWHSPTQTTLNSNLNYGLCCLIKNSTCRSPLPALPLKTRIKLMRYLITVTTITKQAREWGSAGRWAYRVIPSGIWLWACCSLKPYLAVSVCISPSTMPIVWPPNRRARTTIERTDEQGRKKVSCGPSDGDNGGARGRRVGLPARPLPPPPLRPSIPPLHTERRTAAARGREGG